MATNPEIYEFIVQGCRRLRLPAPFDRLHNRLMLRTACRDPQAFLAGLQAQFSVEDLSAAGVLIEGRLHPTLAKPRALILPLYEGPGQPPFDLVVGGDMLGRPSSLPARLVLRDFRIAKLLARNRQRPLCAVSSMLDLAILLALGVPAAPVRGLSTMTAAVAKRFWKQLQQSSSREGDSSVELVLVDWSLARLNGRPAPA